MTASPAHDPAAPEARPRPLLNTALLTAATLVAKGCSLPLLVVTLHTLSKEEYGDYRSVLAFVGLFTVGTDLGLSTLAVREIAADRARLPRYWGNVLSLRLLLALAVAALCVAVASVPALHYGATTRAGIALWALALVPITAVGVAGIAFQAVERMAALSALTAVTAALSSLLGILVLLLGGHVLALLGALGAVYGAAALAALALASRVAPPRPRLEVRWWPALLRMAVPFAVLTALNVLYSNADLLIVRAVRGAADAGLYGAAYSGVNTFLALFITPFNSAALPAFTRVLSSSRERFGALVLAGLCLTLAAGVPVAAVVVVYARAIMLLVGKLEYLPAVPALQWLALSFPLFAVLAILYNALYAAGRAGTLTVIFGVTLVFNVLLNLLLVPRYSFVASAALTTASEALNVALAGLYVRRAIVDPLRAWPAVPRVAGAGLIMVLVLWALRPAGLFVGASLGALAYLAAARLLRVFGPEERAILAHLPLAGRYARLL